jgi:hypothetical protein
MREIRHDGGRGVPRRLEDGNAQKSYPKFNIRCRIGDGAYPGSPLGREGQAIGRSSLGQRLDWLKIG